MNVSITTYLSFPQEQPFSAFRIRFRPLALLTMDSPCFEKVRRGSNVTPNIFGYRTVGISWSPMRMSKGLLTSFVQDVNSVAVDFCTDSCRLRMCRNCTRVGRYAFIFLSNSDTSGPVAAIVQSSAYVISFTPSDGVGIEEIYVLKINGERTPPCGTPILLILAFDLALLNSA